MLDARQLEALAAVVEHSGFGPAAKALNLTLAAVSLRIKALEEHLGQRLLVRGKSVRATAAGQALLVHVKQLQMMEADLLAGLQGDAQPRAGARWQSLSVAINADSAASWFLPGVAPMLQRHRLLLDIVIDDQDHTHDALKSGEVMGCVTTLAKAMRGCVAEPLGVMRYRCVATPAVVQRCRTPAGAVSPHKLLATARTRCRTIFWRSTLACVSRATRAISRPPWMRSRWPLPRAWAGAWCPSKRWRTATICKNCCPVPRSMWCCTGNTGRANRRLRSG